ncbi:MAG: M23 family metallopeptidase, partial [Ruminococcus sp.]|nr:M23 family metallopeptidase [Candidatus Copronaster equi]
SHYITSPYGKRTVISTSAGKTASYHQGTDYGTNNLKIAQYAIESGSIISCGTASDGAKYVWVKYPRINKKFLHYHLDSIKVKTGQSVSKGTLLGYTGMTGKATGIHLHLGVKDLTTGNYEDPEAFSKKYKAVSETTSKYTTGTYTVTADLLHVRKGPSTSYAFLKSSQLTANAQSQNKKLNNGKGADGLVKGCVCTVSQISNNWGKIPSGWICLDYCKKV